MKRSITLAARKRLVQLREDGLRHLREIDRLHEEARQILEIDAKNWPMADDHVADMLNGTEVDDTLETIGVRVRS